MILNYIKMAFRNIIKQKLYSLINIFGLAIGMTGTMLILVYVFNEISYENFHENKDRIFRIGVQFGSNDSAIKLAGAMPAIAPALEEEISFVEKAVRFNLARKAVIKIENDEYQESNFFFTDSNVFSVFTFHVIEKLKNNPLDEPYTAAISESTAKKLFNDENPIGKTFIYNDNYTIKVTAVFADIEGNTHLKPNILVSYKTKEIIDPVEQPWNSWGEAFTYVLLNNKSEAGKLKENINSIFAKHTNEHFAKMFTFHIEPLPDIYLKSEMNGDLIEHGNLSYVYLFSSIAILVFIIACLNFINLSTARSFHRSKEVGVRKVLGANRTQLIRQFLSESVIISLISLIASLILFELLYPVLNNFLGSALIIDHHRTIEFYLLAFSIFLIVGLIAGMYPAFYLSYFNPIKTVDLNRIVKGNGLGFRRILVIVQFAISTILIFGTTVIYQQLNYMKNTDLGFDKNNVLLISF
ncbi:MAG: ABC transporter permease, partial [Melioribacteraceae bacterium]|nr:ABC transporter permease [Melioribacteraceae bacterium]